MLAFGDAMTRYLTSVGYFRNVQRPLAFVLFAAVFVLSGRTAHGEPAGLKPEAERRPVSAFELKDLGGKPVRSTDLGGRVVVVSFWATWCAPCLQELGFLESYSQRYGQKGLSVLAISTDGPETRAQVRSVARRKGWTMPVLVDTAGSALAKLNPRGVAPYTVFLDRNGKIAYSHEGYTSGDETKYKEIIEGLLDKG